MAGVFDLIKGAVDEVKETIGDIVTIDVVTLTGSITIEQAQKDGHIDLQQLYKTIEEQAKVAGNLDVIAFSHIELDADSINFVKKDLTEEQKALLIAHNESVKAAQETRAGIVSMVRSFF